MNTLMLSLNAISLATTPRIKGTNPAPFEAVLRTEETLFPNLQTVGTL